MSYINNLLNKVPSCFFFFGSTVIGELCQLPIYKSYLRTAPKKKKGKKRQEKGLVVNLHHLNASIIPTVYCIGKGIIGTVLFVISLHSRTIKYPKPFT